jgi:hypothetical protein
VSDTAFAEKLTNGELAVVVHEIASGASPIAGAYLAEAAVRLGRSDERLRAMIRGMRRLKGLADA